jgi:hypothetical protein
MRRPGREQKRLEADYRLPLRAILLRDLRRGLQQKDMAALYRVSHSVLSYWILREGIRRGEWAQEGPPLCDFGPGCRLPNEALQLWHNTETGHIWNAHPSCLKFHLEMPLETAEEKDGEVADLQAMKGCGKK